MSVSLGESVSVSAPECASVSSGGTSGDEIKHHIQVLIGGGVLVMAAWIGVTAWLGSGLLAEQLRVDRQHFESGYRAAHAQAEAARAAAKLGVESAKGPELAADPDSLAWAAQALEAVNAEIAALHTLRSAHSRTEMDGALSAVDSRLAELRTALTGTSEDRSGLEAAFLRTAEAMKRVEIALDAELEQVDAEQMGRVRHALELLSVFTILLAGAGAVLARRALRLVDAAGRRRRETEAELRERTDALAEAHRVARLCTWWYHDATGHVYLAPETRALLHLNPGTERLSQEEGLALVHPDDRARIQAEGREAAEQGTRMDVEFRVVLPDGQERVVHLRAESLDPAHPGRLSGTLQDVTERRRLQQTLRETGALLDVFSEHSRDVFWVRDARTWETLYVSPAFESVWGRPLSDLPASAEGFLELVHPDDREAIRAAYREVPGHAVTVTFRIVRPDGELRWLRGRMFPLDVIPGMPRRIAGISEDVTDTQVAREDGRRRRAALERAARATTVGELAATISHELGQPLFAIANYARGCLLRAMDNRLDVDAVNEAVGQISLHADRAGTVLARLRDLARGERPRIRPEEVTTLVTGAVRIVRDELPSECRLQVELEPGLPPVSADPVQVAQVLVNLVRNAAEATSEGPTPLVRVRAARDGDRVRLTVVDNGPGISPEASSRLFDPFVSTKPGGMGMGLAISRTIVEAHQGSLWAEPEPGGGTAVAFTLPVARAEATANA